ncbi:uncharacterized protein LOC132309926 [Cornus florida]|uniref:uncharacterized protein LOC132309926 n=1 Tax=Cornus florida TaxID=4283 RepID=UPI002896727A|nr:uncharacterized protein LOC132309926 [Cornus florida]
MSVTEYENRFISLSRFAPEVVRDEANKTRKFVSGLNDRMRPLITAQFIKVPQGRVFALAQTDASSGPSVLRVKLIRQRLLTAQSRQKSYADKRRRPLSFEVGDHVFLRVSPRKGLMRFGKSGKLSPRFIGPFEILDRVGEVAYRLALPPQMDRVHNVFHVSMLRKYERDPSHILSWVDVDIDEDVSYEEGPVQILDTQQKVLRNKTIPIVKVLWKHYGVEEATWGLEQEVRSKYPALFSSSDEQGGVFNATGDGIESLTHRNLVVAAVVGGSPKVFPIESELDVP